MITSSVGSSTSLFCPEARPISGKLYRTREEALAAITDGVDEVMVPDRNGVYQSVHLGELVSPPEPAQSPGVALKARVHDAVKSLRRTGSAAASAVRAGAAATSRAIRRGGASIATAARAGGSALVTAARYGIPGIAGLVGGAIGASVGTALGAVFSGTLLGPILVGINSDSFLAGLALSFVSAPFVGATVGGGGGFMLVASPLFEALSGDRDTEAGRAVTPRERDEKPPDPHAPSAHWTADQSHLVTWYCPKKTDRYDVHITPRFGGHDVFIPGLGREPDLKGNRLRFEVAGRTVELGIPEDLADIEKQAWYSTITPERALFGGSTAPRSDVVVGDQAVTIGGVRLGKRQPGQGG